MINFITACVGGYDMQYANKARACSKDTALRSQLLLHHRPTRTTFSRNYSITPSLNVSGWWNKVLAFARYAEGWIVMMDVDTIIVNNITEIIEYAIKRNELMAGFEDAIHWHGCKFTSSFYGF